jgi:hypothetical protein
MFEVVALQALASICSEHNKKESSEVSVSGLGKLFVSGKYEGRDWPEAENPDETTWVAEQKKKFENRGNNSNKKRRRPDAQVV